MEDSTEELSEEELSEAEDSASSVYRRLTDLGGRVRELLARDDDVSGWFAMWSPVFGAVVRLGRTLSTLALRLKDVALSDEPAPPLEADVREELVGELRDISEKFPDVAEVLFGLGHIDRLVEAIVADDGARRAAAALLTAIAGMVDRMVGSLVEIALGDSESVFGPERLARALERYEDVAQRLLDRWLLPAMAMTRSEAEEETER